MDQGGHHAEMLCAGRKAPQIRSGDSKNRPRRNDLALGYTTFLLPMA